MPADTASFNPSNSNGSAVDDQVVRPADDPSRNDEPLANLTLRVRQSLDFRLGDLVHALRREGVRSSKKELIEMLLSELPSQPSEELRARLRTYRELTPRDRLGGIEDHPPGRTV
jgi:hypothetical protein